MLRLLFILLCFSNFAFAQNYVKLNSFTTDQGLPSNHIYDILEDNNGFLWIATDNGLSRFDGKYFQNFSVKEGLPSNDAVELIKEKDGTIWVNCYKQLPAYFDDKNNKFVVINNKQLNTISKSLLKTIINHDGNLVFYNTLGAITFKNKKPLVDKALPNSITTNGQRVNIELKVTQKNNINFIKTLFTNGNKKLDSTLIKTIDGGFNFKISQNRAYFSNAEKLVYRFTIKNLKPFTFKVDTLSIPENNSMLKFSNEHIYVISKKGLISLFNNTTFKLVRTLKAGASANCVYKDRGNRLWVGTLDRGLQLYSNNNIRSIQTSNELINNNFLSVGAKKDIIVAGNYYGEILKIQQNKYSKVVINETGRTIWLRKLLYTSKGFLAIHDLGFAINFKDNKPIKLKDSIYAYAKNAISLSDSVVILGTNSGIIKLNTNNLKILLLQNDIGNSSSLSKINSQSFYYVNGLAKYNLQTNSSTQITLPKKWQDEKITAMVVANNGNLWLNTRNGELLILRADKFIANISSNTGLPENISSMLAYNNKVWLGSKMGIRVITSDYQNKKFKFSVNSISKTDGLPSNTINDFAAERDTIFVATENGIALIPANYKSAYFEIKPQLIDVKINQSPAPILTAYNLKSDQNNITLQFAGIELGGHFKNLQYAVNNITNWTNLTGNTLNIQLNSGENQIYVRAVDVNNQVSKTNIKLSFFIETPFYKAIWFWALAAIIFTASLFWLYNRNRLAHQKAAFQQQLALAEQRNKITADLHDDIGATLSSLQLNSAIANQLVQNDPKKTQKILDKVENQAKDLADKIGDIIWSMKPGKDEFMTIGSRIKNFANDILSATNINYKIKIEDKLNAKLQDIALRKNIVFIAKEAINNAAKYSKAKELNLSLKLVDKTILLTIADNGIGFENQQQLGNGIANMRRRTEELKGDFSINTSPNNGTIITATFPLVP